jgi:hypothetical protein
MSRTVLERIREQYPPPLMQALIPCLLPEGRAVTFEGGRQSGRTTRMIEWAVAAALAGATPMIVARTQNEKHHYHGLLQARLAEITDIPSRDIVRIAGRSIAVPGSNRGVRVDLALFELDNFARPVLRVSDVRWSR